MKFSPAKTDKETIIDPNAEYQISANDSDQ